MSNNSDMGKNIAIAGVVGILGYIGYQVYKDYAKTTVGPGAILILELKWKNLGEVSILPEFRYDLRGGATWTPEGQWNDYVSTPPTVLNPGTTSELIAIQSKPVPSDWLGWNIDVKLVARAPGVAEDTVWEKIGVYKVESV